MMQSRRENAAYAEMVETGKKLDKIEERNKKRGNFSLNSSASKPQKQRGDQRQVMPMKDGSDRSAKFAVLGGLL
jgi:hypothetical protein